MFYVPGRQWPVEPLATIPSGQEQATVFWPEFESYTEQIWLPWQGLLVEHGLTQCSWIQASLDGQSTSTRHSGSGVMTARRKKKHVVTRIYFVNFLSKGLSDWFFLFFVLLLLPNLQCSRRIHLLEEVEHKRNALDDSLLCILPRQRMACSHKAGSIDQRRGCIAQKSHNHHGSCILQQRIQLLGFLAGQVDRNKLQCGGLVCR